jgi:hypothetical protein
MMCDDAWAHVLRQTHASYVNALRAYLAETEPLVLKGWPDRKQMVLAQTRLKNLVCDRAIGRFDYIVKHSNMSELRAVTSLRDINKRIEADWSVEDERALKGQSSAYCEVVREVDLADAKRDPAALAGPFQAVRSDAEWKKVAAMLAAKLQELDEHLKQEATRLLGLCSSQDRDTK